MEEMELNVKADSGGEKENNENNKLYVSERDHTMRINDEMDGHRSTNSNDHVANALSEITEAPNELADYVKLLVSTYESPVISPNLIGEIGQTLTQDGMVTASGAKLDAAVSLAVKCILKQNHNFNHNDKKDSMLSQSRARSRSCERSNSKKLKTSSSASIGAGRERRVYGRPGHTVPPPPPPPPPPVRNYNDHGRLPVRFHNNISHLQKQPQHQQSKNFNYRGPPTNNHTSQYEQHDRLRPPLQRERHQTQDQHSQRNVSQPSHHPHNRNSAINGYNQNNIPPPPPPPPQNHQQHHYHHANKNNQNPSRTPHSHVKAQQQDHEHNGRKIEHGYGSGAPTHQPLIHNSHNLGQLPPPPPPPLKVQHRRPQNRSYTPLPEGERRTIFLTNIPPQVTHTQLLTYFTRKMNVHVHKLFIQAATKMDNNSVENLKNSYPENITPLTQIAYVELATHDQALFIFHSPDPVLGNRFIGIRIHHTNLIKSRAGNGNNNHHSMRSTTNNQKSKNQKSHQQPKYNEGNVSVVAPSYYRHEQSPSSSSNNRDSTDVVDVNRNALSSEGSFSSNDPASALSTKVEHKPHQPPNDENQLLITYQKQESLLQKQEEILEKQLTAHKKLLSLMQGRQQQQIQPNLEQVEPHDPNSVKEDPKQQLKLKEILALQKKLNQTKKDRFEFLNKIKELEKAISHQSQSYPAPHHHGVGSGSIGMGQQIRRNYSLDKRTTTLIASSLPKKTNEDQLKSHFSKFGKVINLEMCDENDIALVTFSNRIFAERAKENGALYNETTISFQWYSKEEREVSSASMKSSLGNMENELNQSKKSETNIEETEHRGADEGMSSMHEQEIEEDDADNDDEERWR